MQRHIISLVVLTAVSLHSSNGQWVLISDPSGYAQSLVPHQGSIIMSVAFGRGGLWRMSINQQATSRYPGMGETRLVVRSPAAPTCTE